MKERKKYKKGDTFLRYGENVCIVGDVCEYCGSPLSWTNKKTKRTGHNIHMTFSGMKTCVDYGCRAGIIDTIEMKSPEDLSIYLDTLKKLRTLENLRQEQESRLRTIYRGGRR